MAELERRLGWSPLAVPLLVLAGGSIASGRLAPQPFVWWAALAGASYATALAPRAGDFLVFAGVVLGTASAMLIGGPAVAVGLAGFAAGVASRSLPPSGIASKLVHAVLAGLPLMYGALAVGRPADGLLPWMLSAWVQLVRELVDGVEGAPGTRTATAVLALVFVPTSLVWPARAGYGAAYFLLAIFADLALLVVGTRLLVGRLERLPVLVNGAMALGLIALVAGKLR